MKYTEKELNIMVDNFLQEQISKTFNKEICFDNEFNPEEIKEVSVLQLLNLIKETLKFIIILKDNSNEK